MRDIISLLFLLLFVIIRAAFCGYTTKTINESKGYTGGFWMGVLLAELGILIAVFKKELPDAPPNSYRVVSVVKVLKKFHYPFVSPQVEPIDILKGNIYAEGEAAKVNLVFWLIHGMFMLAWYSVILGAYLWYIIGYTIYWLFKYKLFKKGTAEDSVISAVNAQSIKDSVVGGIGGLKERAGSTASKLSQKTEGVKTGAAEKAALAKEKAGAAFAVVKGKASEFAAERKKAENNPAPSDDISEEASITSTGANAAKKALDTSISTSETISEASESSSFDELYEKAMNTDDEEITDESSFSEAGAEESYNGETVNEVKTPVAASVNPDSTPTITQQPAPSQYDNSEKKKSPVVFVLVGVIAVLLVGMGILGGMLLTKNKDDKGSDNSSDNEVIAATTKEKSAEANTVSAQTVTSETTATSQEKITSSEATTEAAKVERVDTSDAVKRALIAHLDKEYANEKSQEYYFFDRDVKYAVYDVNADGVDELFIYYESTASYNTDVYLYQNNDYVFTRQVWEGGISVCLDDHFLFVQQYGGAMVTRIFTISEGNLVQSDELKASGAIYTHNDISIPQNEYENLLSNYQNKNLIEISNNAKPVSEIVDMSPYQKQTNQNNNTDNNRNLYNGYDFIENAPSDMTFADNTNILSVPTGVIKTDSTGLNLRKGPGSSYDVILELPKGDTVYVYGRNSEWCYVGWEAPTRTVDGSFPVFRGYVSRDYLSIGVG